MQDFKITTGISRYFYSGLNFARLKQQLYKLGKASAPPSSAPLWHPPDMTEVYLCEPPHP